MPSSDLPSKRFEIPRQLRQGMHDLGLKRGAMNNGGSHAVRVLHDLENMSLLVGILSKQERNSQTQSIGQFTLGRREENLHRLNKLGDPDAQISF